jgi:hypothetical protein
MSLSSLLSRKSARPFLIPLGIYLTAVALGLGFIHAGGHAASTRIGAALLMGAAIIGTAAVAKSEVFPRPIMMTAASILATALVAAAALSSRSSSAIDAGLYAWLFIWLLGVSPRSGSRWCQSRVLLLAGAFVLGASLILAEVVMSRS